MSDKYYYCSRCHGVLHPTEMTNSKYYSCKQCGARFDVRQVENIALNERREAKHNLWGDIITMSLALGVLLPYGSTVLVNKIAGHQVFSDNFNRYNVGLALIIFLVSAFFMWKYYKKRGLI